MGFEIVRAARADRAAVVATVVAAFAADPAFRYFFPDDDTYPHTPRPSRAISSTSG